MTQQREHWGSRLGFIMAAAGSAVGLGSLWRFPYLVGQNGGGVFVLFYLIFTALIALPVFIGELVIGRHTQRGAIQAYSNLSHHSPNWRMAGWLNLLTSFVILSFYCVIAGWGLNYVFMSLSNFTSGMSPAEIKNVFVIMQESADINIFWFFLFMLLNVGVVIGGVKKGIEHWSKILTPALFVILLGLLAYSVTLDGFGAAFKYLLYPDFSKFTPSGLLDSLGMAFFTLSVGLGIILTYGSYMKPDEDLMKTGLIVTTMTVLVSLMAALMIFPIIFTFGFEPGEGPGLIFQTLPILFEKLPGTLLVSTVFFALFVFTALTSSISLLEMIVANLMEVLNWTRKRALAFASITAFLFGIPSAVAGSSLLFSNWSAMYGGKNFFLTMSEISGSWCMPIGGLLTALFVGWKMDRKLVENEYLRGSKMGKLLRVWLFAIRWLCPLAILLIILQDGGIIELDKLFEKLFMR